MFCTYSSTPNTVVNIKGENMNQIFFPLVNIWFMEKLGNFINNRNYNTGADFQYRSRGGKPTKGG
jgi:hypothetical protein